MLYPLGLKKCFAVSSITLYLTSLCVYTLSDKFLVIQKRILARTENLPRYIWHLVVSDFALSSFNCTQEGQLFVLSRLCSIVISIVLQKAALLISLYRRD